MNSFSDSARHLLTASHPQYYTLNDNSKATFASHFLTMLQVAFMIRLSSVRLSVCNGCIVVKRCEIEPKLLLITNVKLHIGFQIT